MILRNSPPLGVLLQNGILEICLKTQRKTLMPKLRLQSNFIEITLPHVCSSLNSMLIFRTPMRAASGFSL